MVTYFEVSTQLKVLLTHVAVETGFYQGILAVLGTITDFRTLAQFHIQINY